METSTIFHPVAEFLEKLKKKSRKMQESKESFFEECPICYKKLRKS